MPDAPKDDEVEKRRDELLRRMLKTPPKPHKPKQQEGPARKPGPKAKAK